MKEIVSLKNNTVSTFVGALAGGAMVMAVVYATMPSARPVQATPIHHDVVASNAVNNNDSGLGNCTVQTSANDGYEVPTLPSFTTTGMPGHSHSYPVGYPVIVPVPVPAPGNTTTTNTNSSSAEANHDLVGIAANALNNSLNGNTVSVPVLSNNNVGGVLNNSNILSGNDVASDNDGNLNNVLNGNTVVKAVTGIVGIL